VSLLKFVKKIGRYSRKIGVGIGGSDSRNFAHLWLWVIFGVLDPDPADQNKWGGDPGVSGFRIHNIA
jgi:hypothetical protein